ncbi:SxtJ family membrane protein [Pelagibacteraceae bacterium]|nr:SxtJ family membrane protein [Pelagibacteraceae bacterium]
MTPQSSNRSFGLLFFIIFFSFALWPLIKSETLNIYLLFISLIFLTLGSINSKLLSPLNRTWIKFGEILGAIIAPIVMGLVYFLVLTPISLIVRILGKDLIGLKFSKKQDTYWIRRKKIPGPMNKQF